MTGEGFNIIPSVNPKSKRLSSNFYFNTYRSPASLFKRKSCIAYPWNQLFSHLNYSEHDWEVENKKVSEYIKNSSASMLIHPFRDIASCSTYNSNMILETIVSFKIHKMIKQTSLGELRNSRRRYKDKSKKLQFSGE